MHGASEADAALVIGALLAYPTFGGHEERELELGRELYRGDPTRVLQRARESRETMSIPTPEADRVIEAPRGKGGAIRTERHSPHPLRMPDWLRGVLITVLEVKVFPERDRRGAGRRCGGDSLPQP